MLGPLCSGMPLDNGGFLRMGGGQPTCRTGLRRRSRSSAKFTGGTCRVLINALMKTSQFPDGRQTGSYLRLQRVAITLIDPDRPILNECKRLSSSIILKS